MTLIITSQEQFKAVYYDSLITTVTTDGTYSKILLGNVSYCEAQNNYTMEFEYLFYSNSSNIDCSVVVCGVILCDQPLQYSSHLCWGQSFGITPYESPTDMPDHPPDVITMAIPTATSRWKQPSWPGPPTTAGYGVSDNSSGLGWVVSTYTNLNYCCEYYSTVNCRIYSPEITQTTERKSSSVCSDGGTNFGYKSGTDYM